MSIIQGKSNALVQMRRLINRPNATMLGIVTSVSTATVAVDIRGTVYTVSTGGFTLAVGDSVQVASGMVQKKLKGTLGVNTSNIITQTGG